MAIAYFNVWGTTLAKLDTATGKIEQWDDGEWCPGSMLAPEIVGGEAGATQITAAEAEKLKTTTPKALAENKASWY